MTACTAEDWDDMAENRSIVMFTKGVNLLDDPHLLADGEVAWAQNLYPYTPGRLQRRKAMTFRERLALSAGSPDLLRSFTKPTAESGYSYLYAFFDGVDLILNRVADVEYSTRLGPPTDKSRPFVLQDGKNVYVLVGTSGPSRLVTPVTAPFVVGTDPYIRNLDFGSQVVPVYPNTAGIYKQRMLYGDLGVGFENYLMMSDPFDYELVGPDVLASSGRAFTVGGPGERIVAIIEVTQGQGADPNQSVALVLTSKKAFLIQGELNQTTDTGTPTANLDIIQFPRVNGCISAESVVRTPFGVIWASEDNVWAFDGASPPYAIGTKIQPALKKGFKKHLNHAVYHDGAYKLAVVGERGGEYLCQEQWWLDIRKGLPESYETAQWWGPMRYKPAVQAGAENTTEGTYMMAVDQDTGELLGLHQAMADGQTLVVSFEATQSWDVAEYQLASSPKVALDRTMFKGSQVETKLIPKTYVADGMVDFKPKHAEIRVRVGGPTKLQLGFDMDDGTSTDSSSKTLNPTGLIAGTGSLDTDVLTDKFTAVSVFPTKALNGKDLKLTLTDLPSNGDSYTVDSSNDTGYVYESDSDSWHPVTMPQGTYATFAALAAQLQTSLTAAFAITDGWFVNVDSPATNQVELLPGGGYTIGMAVTSTTVQGHGLTDLQVAKSKAFWQQFGFYTISTPTGTPLVEGLDHIDSETNYPDIHPALGNLEIGSFQAYIDIFGRRP
jgi:hypothetical protein